MTPEPHDATGAPRQIVVVGAGIAGVSAVEAARQTDPGARITLVSDEVALPYYCLNLTRYLAGETAEADLPLHPAAWYEERAIEEAGEGAYRRFVFRAGRLIGAILLGDTAAMAAVRKAIERGTDFSDLLHHSLSADDVARGLVEAA